MSEPMTPQERAAAIAEQIVRALDVFPSPINTNAVLPWVKETRRAALLEAAVEMRDGCKEPNCPQCTRIAERIDRLAQEG